MTGITYKMFESTSLYADNQAEGQITWEKVYEIFEIFRDFKDFKDFYRFQRFL